MVVSLDCCDEAAQAAALLGRKRFRGKYHGTTMETNKRDWNSVSNSFGQVHGQTSLTASHDITSFVGQRRDVMRWPPACD